MLALIGDLSYLCKPDVRSYNSDRIEFCEGYRVNNNKLKQVNL